MSDLHFLISIEIFQIQNILRCLPDVPLGFGEIFMIILKSIQNLSLSLLTYPFELFELKPYYYIKKIHFSNYY